MNKRRIVCIIVLILMLFLVCISIYLKLTRISFNATIIEINGKTSIDGESLILIQGLPENDINFRGKFYLLINKQTLYGNQKK